MAYKEGKMLTSRRIKDLNRICISNLSMTDPKIFRDIFFLQKVIASDEGCLQAAGSRVKL